MAQCTLVKEYTKLGHNSATLLSLREPLALNLAEHMTYTGKWVTDKFFNWLNKHFTDEELVELAAAIALEKFRSQFNPVFGIEANNFSPLPGVKDAAPPQRAVSLNDAIVTVVASSSATQS